MKLTSFAIPAALCAVVALPGATAAQSMPDMTLSLTYADQIEEDDYQNLSLGASLSNTFANGFGYQVDGYFLSYHHYPGDEIKGITVHLTYDYSDTTSVGAFYGWQDWEGSEYRFFGLEGKTTIDDVRLEASLAGEYEPGDTELLPIWSIIGHYDLNDQYTLSTGIGGYDDNPTAAMLALSRDFGDQTVEFKAINTGDEGVILSLSVSMDFGSGATFSRPDYVQLFNVW